MTRTHVLPEGDYWIGDPCYPFPNIGEKVELWTYVLEESDYFSKPVNLPNIKIWAANTTYGDGYFYSRDGKYEFGVDSGTLGIMTKETVDYLGEDPDYVSTCGILVHFEKEFNVIFSDGYFKFGHIEIDTQAQEEDDEDDFWDDDEDDS